MSRFLPAAFVAAAALVIAGASASAQMVVFRSHGTFHIQACPGPAAPGHARCHAHIVTDEMGTPLLNRFSRNRVGTNFVPSGYGPADLRSAYNVTGSGSSTTLIAVVDAYGYNNAASDLATYRSTFHLPVCGTGCFTKVNQRGVQGSYPRQNTGWAQETALDLDMVSAMCPSCHILLVEANSSSYGDLAAAVNTAASFGAHAISNSYGGGENGSQPYESAYNHPGAVVLASSGDSGYPQGAQFPASSPHVIGAGGTSLYRDNTTARGWSESAWSGAGSGCSSVYFKPSWQKDTGCGARMVADVSAIADPNTGVAVYGPANSRSSAWQVYGGTSVASPLLAGVYGVNGGAVVDTSGTPIPYTDPAGINDVTTGSNGNCGGTYFCNAGPGYDGPTGLGTPNGSGAF